MSRDHSAPIPTSENVPVNEVIKISSMGKTLCQLLLCVLDIHVFLRHGVLEHSIERGFFDVG